MPSVAIAHTAEKQRSFESVRGVVEEALSELGGMAAFVKPGQTVLLIPDQSVCSPAERGSTADPLVVAALIRLARHAGAAGIQVGASSAGFLDSLECMERTGLAALARAEGAELLDLGSDRVENREVPLPEGRVLDRVPLPVPLLEADVVLTVPKARNDYLDSIAGAMRMTMGAVNQRWRARQLGAGDAIGRFADLMSVMRPDLSVTDALICGEGDGPLAMVPRWSGCILASPDPVAMDVAIARLMGHDWTKLRFVEAGRRRGLGSPEPIVWLGTAVERVAFEAWRGHEGERYLPVNFLVGEGVTPWGTVGHVKSALDGLLRRGVLEEVIRARGTPTIVAGYIEDPDFERHIAGGPYIVFDDAARPEYKSDPRVFFVPGHPVLETAMPELLRALRIEAQPTSGDGVYRAARRKLGAAAAPVSAAALALGAVLGIRALARRP